ncbi:hypothetical protein kac65v162_gp038 [Nodularia phage vB_NspS-kac65v162]|jgi:hypothetical protein|uniref:Uncharacterized protein n=1 Tax=Nodularia phage vB_NspS-kac65v162 TaxID=2557581 RepID=A0A482MJK1_9CAUD|nr:hypothetical protein kac65v162_gp038 [Nodularia phage vB_NspS-kac65v162]
MVKLHRLSQTIAGINPDTDEVEAVSVIDGVLQTSANISGDVTIDTSLLSKEETLAEVRDRLPTGQDVAVYLVVTTAGIITAGKKSVAITNIGNTTGTLLGQSLKPGVSVSWAARTSFSSSFAYDPNGGEFLISFTG